MGAHDVFVVGASGHAQVVIDIIERQQLWRIAGLIDTYKRPGSRVMGYEVLGPETRLPDLLAEDGATRAVVAIGDNRTRHQVVARIGAIAPALGFINAIHPAANIARGVEIGQGVVIMPGVTINSGTRIGDFCFVNTNASVDHDNILEPFSCIQPNAATGGNVRLGAFSVLAMGANIIQGITIGADTLIGAGSTVLSDIPDGVVAYGTPCRVIRSR
ncbi:MAG: acetyltransferase [Bryobacteraceae bacterium]|jgi:sugar O-acyltransferase (sialic acid O-acetyltransferase NeuD family)